MAAESEGEFWRHLRSIYLKLILNFVECVFQLVLAYGVGRYLFGPNIGLLLALAVVWAGYRHRANWQYEDLGKQIKEIRQLCEDTDARLREMLRRDYRGA